MNVGAELKDWIKWMNSPIPGIRKEEFVLRTKRHDFVSVLPAPGHEPP